jgi:predicted transcriptional regulator
MRLGFLERPARSGVPEAQERLLHALDGTEQSVTARELRSLCRMRTSAVSDALSALLEQQLVLRDDGGYRIAQP